MGLTLRKVIWVNFSRMERIVKRDFYLIVGSNFRLKIVKETTTYLGVALASQKFRKRAS